MCDTLYKKTLNGFVFGKNSDRSPNEPNLAIFYPPKEHNEDKVQCTYISIDQVSKTNGLLLIQPSWMWGGEMGVNDKGIVIGNEAVFTKSKGKKENRLLGMDMLRLALERGDNAEHCLNIIISLLETYGQGGNCGFDKSFYYDNSFLIVDKEIAYILETCGRDWVCKRLDNYGNISNRLSLNDNYYKSNNQREGFAKRNSDLIFTYFSGSLNRQQSAKEYLKKDNLSLHDMIDALTHHHNHTNLYTKGSIKSVCMHNSLLGDHTTSSMIVCTSDNIETIWLTGASTPCISIYKPVYFSTIIPPVFDNHQLSLDYWLEREYLARAIFANLVDEKDYQDKKHQLQMQFIDEEQVLLKTNPTKETLVQFSRKCSELEQEFINSYRIEIEKIKVSYRLLPKLWQKCTKNLGKNVFEIDLSKRLNK